MQDQTTYIWSFLIEVTTTQGKHFEGQTIQGTIAEALSELDQQIEYDGKIKRVIRIDPVTLAGEDFLEPLRKALAGQFIAKFEGLDGMRQEARNAVCRKADWLGLNADDLDAEIEAEVAFEERHIRRESRVDLYI